MDIRYQYFHNFSIQNNEDVILISSLKDSTGSKPNPCTVRTHQEKRENSATEEIYNSVLELFICTSDRTT